MWGYLRVTSISTEVGELTTLPRPSSRMGGTPPLHSPPARRIRRLAHRASPLFKNLPPAGRKPVRMSSNSIAQSLLRLSHSFTPCISITDRRQQRLKIIERTTTDIATVEAPRLVSRMHCCQLATQTKKQILPYLTGLLR